MVWWIVGGLVLLGLVVLALAAMPVVARLRPLRGAMVRLQRRAEDAQRLQVAAEALQERVAILQEHAETARGGLATLQDQRNHRKR